MTLEFKRTSRFNTDKLPAKRRKDWLSVKPARYRITFRCEVFGVSVPAAYQATCLCHVPGNFEGGKTQSWCFVDIKRKLFKTYRKAVEACEKHSQLWEKALACPSMRAIKQLFGGHKPAEVPVWIYGKLHPSILRIIMDNRPIHFTDDELDEEHFEERPEPESESESELAPEVVQDIEDAMKDIEEAMGQPMPKRRGRPKGSKNKVAVVSEETTATPKKRGRPKGSKNSKPRIDKGKKRGQTD